MKINNLNRAIARVLKSYIDLGWTPDNALSAFVCSYNGQNGIGEPIPVDDRINMNRAFDIFENETGETIYAYAERARQ